MSNQNFKFLAIFQGKSGNLENFEEKNEKRQFQDPTITKTHIYTYMAIYVL